MSKKPLVRDYFSDRVEVLLVCDDESRCQQQFSKEQDINFIIDRYLRTGQLPAAAEGVYADLASLPGNLAEAYEFVERAESGFGELPASLRERFDHDPVKFVEFCQDERNFDEAVKLGLLTPVPSPQPADPAPVDPKGSGAKAKPPKGAEEA